jgi:predicted kinase
VTGKAALIVFGGLPGTGKTTLARALVVRLGAIYLRIDTIEQAMKDAGAVAIGAAGYAAANEIAVDNLVLGRPVGADCVNPVRDSRLGWRHVAARAGCRMAEIELVCSDAAEHRRRVETRSADSPGLILPSWDEVRRREYDAIACSVLIGAPNTL